MTENAAPPTALKADDRIPEDRIPAILARAAELDRDRRETITVDAIRTAALDAGISPSALDAALEEYAAHGEMTVDLDDAREERKPRFGRLRGFLRKSWSALQRPLKLAGIFFVLGVAGAAGEGMVVIAWVAWLLMIGRTIWKQRPARKAAPYVLSLVLMTVGLAIGFAAGEVDEDAIAIIFAIGAALLVLGSAIIKLRLPRRFRSGAREIEAPAS